MLLYAFVVFKEKALIGVSCFARREEKSFVCLCTRSYAFVCFCLLGNIQEALIAVSRFARREETCFVCFCTFAYAFVCFRMFVFCLWKKR